MSKRIFHLENFKQHYPSHKLNEENYGVTHAHTWPLLWYGHQEEEHFYRIKAEWKLIGICSPPFPSKCDGNNKAFVAELVETGEVFWWHFTPKTVVIDPKNE